MRQSTCGHSSNVLGHLPSRVTRPGDRVALVKLPERRRIWVRVEEEVECLLVHGVFFSCKVSSGHTQLWCGRFHVVGARRQRSWRGCRGERGERGCGSAGSRRGCDTAPPSVRPSCIGSQLGGPPTTHEHTGAEQRRLPAISLPRQNGGGERCALGEAHDTVKGAVLPGKCLDARYGSREANARLCVVVHPVGPLPKLVDVCGRGRRDIPHGQRVC